MGWAAVGRKVPSPEAQRPRGPETAPLFAGAAARPAATCMHVREQTNTIHTWGSPEALMDTSAHASYRTCINVLRVTRCRDHCHNSLAIILPNLARVILPCFTTQTTIG